MATEEEIEKKAMEMVAQKMKSENHFLVVCCQGTTFADGEFEGRGNWDALLIAAEQELNQEAAQAAEDERLGRVVAGTCYTGKWEHLPAATRGLCIKVAKAVLEAAKSQPAAAPEVKLPFEITDRYGDSFKVFVNTADRIVTDTRNDACSFSADQADQLAAAFQAAARQLRGGK